MKQSTLILSFLLVTFTTFSQTKSFGVLGGMSTFTQSNSNITASGGMYIDLGRFGFEYTQSASLNTSSQDALNYINGNTNSYTGGGKTDNYGVFFKIKPKNKSSIYVGGGIQKSNIIKAEDIITKTQVRTYPNIIYVPGPQPMTTVTTVTPTVVSEDKDYVYGSLGVFGKLSDNFSFKGGVIISKTIIMTIGFGYNF
jgi:hypothetical protein